MGFYDNYVSLCNLAGKSPSAVALEIGLTKPTVNRWKNGSMPTDATIRKVADFFGVSVAELKETLNLQDVIYETAKANDLVKAKQLLEADNEQKKTALLTESGNENEKEFMNLFLQLSPEEQARELLYLRDVVNRKGI